MVGLRINEGDLGGSFWAAFSFIATRDRNKIRWFFPACIGDLVFPVSPSLAISNSIKRHVGVPKEDEIEFSSFPLFYICEKGEGSFLDFRILLFLSISHAGTHSPAGQLKKRRGFMSIFFAGATLASAHIFLFCKKDGKFKTHRESRACA